LKAVRELKSSGSVGQLHTSKDMPVHDNAVAAKTPSSTSSRVSEAAKEEPPVKSFTHKEILDDPNLNSIMAAFPGADIKGIEKRK
jgi:hypothetical protein